MQLSYSTFIITTCFLLLVACGSNTPDSSSPSQDSLLKPEQENEKTIYRVGIDSSYPPYGFIDEQGKAIGFEADLISAIADNQNFSINLEPVSWDNLFVGLDRHSYSIALGGFAYSDLEEPENYLMSIPHIYGQEAIATLEKNKDVSPKSFTELKNHKVATLANSGWVDDLSGIMNKENILAENTTFLALQKVYKEEAEVILNDRGVLNYYGDSIPEFTLTLYSEGDYFSPYEMIMLLNKDESELSNKVNQGLKNIVSNGEYTKIYNKWFHEQPVQLPSS